jgi:hypothetical protein
VGKKTKVLVMDSAVYKLTTSFQIVSCLQFYLSGRYLTQRSSKVGCEYSDYHSRRKSVFCPPLSVSLIISHEFRGELYEPENRFPEFFSAKNVLRA